MPRGGDVPRGISMWGTIAGYILHAGMPQAEVNGGLQRKSGLNAPS